MNILVTIPHVFNPDGGGQYASLSANPQPRIVALTECLRALHGLYGAAQIYFHYHQHQLYKLPANQNPSVQLDIIICTTQGLHLLNQIPVSANFYQHQPMNCDPMLLGFECHGILKKNLGNYDYYCYLEDDLILHDPSFFQKLIWFNSFVEDTWVLQPNRFEWVKQPDSIIKNYIDPELLFKTGQPGEFAHYFKDHLTILGKVMGQDIVIKRAENPHSGCFFLNQKQMEYWASQHYFQKIDCRFFGPLESAATLGLARTFRVYKPAPENANFIEIQHFGDKWSEKIKDTVFY
jgi:hypothetical protein